MLTSSGPGSAYSGEDVASRLTGLMDAGDRLDLAAFIAFFHPDADFHNPIGMVLRGREEIRALHQQLYSPTPPAGFPSFAGARSTGRILSLRILAEDVAVADWLWTQEGSTADGAAWPTRHGINTTVWQRDPDAGWQVIAWRDKDFPTDFQPPPGYHQVQCRPPRPQPSVISPIRGVP